jgi:predicted DCC family thiol-disulfide oxidoreductase YuxK
MNAEIHAALPDGSLIKGVEVLRLAYGAVGLGWLLRPTAWAALRPIFDAGYLAFARHRRTISLIAKPLIGGIRELRAQQTAKRMRRCADGACAGDAKHEPASRSAS